MFVLVHNNRVIVGPMGWNKGMFEVGLERVNINFVVPSVQQDETLHIDDNTFIMKARLEYPPYNEKIEYPHGPFWDFSTGEAVGTFQILDTPIELIKNTLKQKVAENRWAKEVAGTKVTIQGKEVTVATDRETRNTVFQKYLLMLDTDTINFKFPETWLVLTKTEFGQVVTSAAQYIEQRFVWEKNKVDEIDACNTAAELDAVLITED